MKEFFHLIPTILDCISAKTIVMRTRPNVTLSAYCHSPAWKNVRLRHQHAVGLSFRRLNQFTDFYKIWYAYYAIIPQKMCFPSGFPLQKVVYTSSHLHICYKPNPSNFSWFLSIYLSGLVTAVAVFRNPNAIPFCLTTDLVLNVLFSWLLVQLPSTFFLDVLFSFSPLVSTPWLILVVSPLASF
jgi:hypothetical protein